VKSFEAIARCLRPEHFDPVSREHHVILPLKHDRVFFHSGDFGDIIYALPAIRALGGGKLIIGPSTHWKTRLQMTPEHVEIMRPLIALQPYIHGFEFSATVPPEIDVNLNQFREYLIVEHDLIRNGARRLNLAESHLYTFKLPLDEGDRAWLIVDQPEVMPHLPVIIHRSARWRNYDFPWDKIMARHAHHAVFVGLESEHKNFIAEWGDLPYRPTNDFLELARIIAGCRLYIGNQSLPYAICEGLKHDSILEVWSEGPNCLFNRKNAIYGESKIVYIPKVKEIKMNTLLEHCPVCGADAKPAEIFRTGSDVVKCQECSLVYLRTHPDEEQTLLYYQQYADDHSHMRLPKNIEDIRTSGLRREYFMQELLKHAPITFTSDAAGAIAQPKLLDIGCGWGAFLANARDKGFAPYGVDVCHKAANFSATVLGIPTVCDELEDCLFTDAMFDVIVAIHTLEHLMNPADALSRIHRLLKPGGIFAGIVPNIDSFCSRTRKEKWQWLDVNTHYVHFAPDTLRSAFVKHDFELLHIYTHTGDYDQAEIKRLLEQQGSEALEGDKLTAALENLWQSNQGEEIRFFARAT